MFFFNISGFIFLAHILGGMQLTAKALAHHNDESTDFSLGGDDMESTGGDTMKTFLSGVSDCSNPAFYKVKRYWESNAASHKEVRVEVYPSLPSTRLVPSTRSRLLQYTFKIHKRGIEL